MKAEITVHRIVKETKNPRQFIEPHKHAFYHLMYGMTGKALVIVKELNEDGEAKDLLYDLEKGSLVIVSPNRIHAIYSETKSVILTIKFNCSSFLDSQILSIPPFIPRANDYQELLLLSILEEAINQSFDYTDMIDLRVYELLINLSRDNQSKKNNQNTPGVPPLSIRSSRLSETLRYIDSHLEEPLTVASISRISGYAESYFSAYFKENVGCTPNYYITLKKMERARELMLFSDLNVTMISEKLGYESIHYFSRVFKKTVGITPAEYINRSRTEQVINVVKNQNTPAGKYEIPPKEYNDPFN